MKFSMSVLNLTSLTGNVDAIVLLVSMAFGMEGSFGNVHKGSNSIEGLWLRWYSTKLFPARNALSPLSCWI